jgi:hypothetical protein
MKKITFVLLAVVLLAGCKNHSNSIQTVESITAQTELKQELKSNRLNYNGAEVETALIDKALSWKDNALVFVSFREKAVYIADLTLNVKKKIFLKKKYDAMFNDKPFDAFINGDTLFIADNSMSLKKLNLVTEEMTKTPLRGMQYFSQPYYMSFAKNGNYIYTFNCFPNSTKDKVKGDFVVGAVFGHNGSLVEQIGVDKDVFDHDLISRDIAFYTEAGDKHYIYFEMEKNVLLLNADNNKTGIKSLYVNKDWNKPVFKNKQLSAYIVNTQQFVPYGDKFIHWPPPGNIEKKGRVVIYDGNVEPVKKVFLAGLEKTAFYSYFTCGDKLIVFSNNRNGDDNVYMYDLKSM